MSETGYLVLCRGIKHKIDDILDQRNAALKAEDDIAIVDAQRKSENARAGGLASDVNALDESLVACIASDIEVCTMEKKGHCASRFRPAITSLE